MSMHTPEPNPKLVDVLAQLGTAIAAVHDVMPETGQRLQVGLSSLFADLVRGEAVSPDDLNLVARLATPNASTRGRFAPPGLARQSPGGDVATLGSTGVQEGCAVKVLVFFEGKAEPEWVRFAVVPRAREAVHIIDEEGQQHVYRVVGVSHVPHGLSSLAPAVSITLADETARFTDEE